METDKSDTAHRPVWLVETSKHLQSETSRGLCWEGVSPERSLSKGSQVGAHHSYRAGKEVA